MKMNNKIKNISSKQSLRNRTLASIKKLQPKTCVICGRPADDLCHLLPKSVWPEWYTESLNLVIMCRSCHQQHDDNIRFRTRQDKLYNQVLKFDIIGANRYYGKNE